MTAATVVDVTQVREARERDHDQFSVQADPYRRELLAHCYRMTGSVHDAEDLVQETFLRAWKSYENFEQRSSLRTWLYKIATNQCLTALEGRNRRPLPSGLGSTPADPSVPVIENAEIPWLEPVPDAMVGADAGDPAQVVTSRESIRLALIVALQYLPPRQRAVLVLRDVLQWKAAEVAKVLDTTPVAVNSMLQRARAILADVSPQQDVVAEPTDPNLRETLNRYLAAFETYNMDLLVKMFTEDAIWEMPPFPEWFVGGEAIGRLVYNQCPAQGPGDMVLLPTMANGQPAFGLYMRDHADGIHKPFQVQVLTVSGGQVTHVVAFFEPALFSAFGLPETVPAR